MVLYEFICTSRITGIIPPINLFDGEELTASIADALDYEHEDEYSTH